MKIKSGLISISILSAVIMLGCLSKTCRGDSSSCPVSLSALPWMGDGKPCPTNDADFYQDDPAPLFRNVFSLSDRKHVSSAVLEMAVGGYYDVFLNGKRISETSLMPLWTPFAGRVLVDTYDVTDKLLPGKNVLAVELGNGWYNPLPLRMWGHIRLRDALCTGRPCFKVRLLLRRDDGTETDGLSPAGGWRFTEGPILRNSVYLGVTFDARREIPGWKLPPFDDTAWREAVPLQGPPGVLAPRTAPALKVISSEAGVSRRLTENVQVVDFGVNGTGVAEFRLGTGNSGERIVIRYGERLFPDGRVNPLTQTAGQIKSKGMGGPGAPDLAEPCDVYIRNGKGPETFLPRFTWHAFRYAQIEGTTNLLGPKDAVRYAIASGVSDAGSFSCSDERLNRLHAVCRQTFLSNLVGVQSDCPGRERFGYGGDIAATAESFLMNFDMRTFYEKTLRDFADEAADDGWLTETAPYVGIADQGFGGRSGPIGWTVAVPILMEGLLRHYGDTRVLTYYPVCARYVRLLRSRFPENLLPHCIGDHEALEKAPVDLTATAHYYQFVKWTAFFANRLGNTADAAAFNVLADNIRTAFIRKYVHGAVVGGGQQDEQAYGLYLGLLPDSVKKDALNVLLKNISDHGDALTTGIFGTRFLLETLSENEQEACAGKLVTRREFPGWLFMLDNGATTVWETWKQSENVFSNNHPMFGTVDEWLIKHLLGLSVSSDAVGANKITVRPCAVAGVTWARGTYCTPHGRVSFSWSLDKNDTMKMKLNIPAGVTARVWQTAQKRWEEVGPGEHQW